MTAVGIDYGDKRCGIAVEVAGFSMSKEICARVKIMSVIKKYCKDYDCDEIVIGLPYDLFGKNLKQLDKTKKFIKNVEELFPDKKVIGIDERFTSFEADSVLKEMGIFNTKNNKDDISAQIILETYLKRREV
ncbi:MAG: Holliday junction resolvase RuvX [Candidatus Gracilibacteria bacterium]|nr:Holliday junction resolvase RuvX [Candidatus Gracilibacteria bacterium]MDQ7022245.1 Holliday junction resolvase RuvX [Candidatus Gracilibacteria bacterium]